MFGKQMDIKSMISFMMVIDIDKHVLMMDNIDRQFPQPSRMIIIVQF